MAENVPQTVGANNSSIKYIWFSFEGRISRPTYWLKYFLPWIGIYIAAGILDAIVGTLFVISLIVSIVGLWPGLAVSIKRCHDRGRTGWFLLIGLIPLLGLWVLVELWFLRGTVGENQYGPETVVE